VLGASTPPEEIVRFMDGLSPDKIRVVSDDEGYKV
jgi:hypothetical protein